MNSSTFTLYLQSGTEKSGPHAVCEHNLRKLLLNNGYLLWNIHTGDNKELIFFAILLTLNILCHIIHDVIDKHVYIGQIWMIGQSDSFGNDSLQFLQRREDTMNNILINVLATVDRL